MAENNDEVVNPDGNPIEETPADTITTEVAPDPNIAADPVVDEIEPNVNPVEVTSVEQLTPVPDNKPATDEPDSTSESEVAEVAEPIEEVSGHLISETPGLYEVQAADLNAYPELSQQGVQLYDEVAFNSLWVNKWATAAHDSYVQVPWPAPIGITFNE